MKRMYLIISLFLCSSHTTHAMEKENEKEKLKPITSILQTIKTLPKKVAASFTKKQPETLITEKSYIKEQACVQAIKDNDPEQLELKLLLGADVNYINDGKSLFYIACEERNKKYTDAKILEILLTHENIDLNARNAQGSTPLHVICQFGLIPIVKSMLNRSTQTLCPHSISAINNQDYNGNTPLHQACKNKQLDLITLLIKKGANTTIQNHKQQTPLYVLFCALKADKCLDFLDNSDPYIRHQLVYTTDHNNNTQLHLCATTSIKDHHQKNFHLDYLLFLIQLNIEIEAHNNKDKTALDLTYEAYEELQNLYQMEQLPYIAQALAYQENILEHFLNFTNASTRRNMPIKQQKPHIHTTQQDLSHEAPLYIAVEKQNNKQNKLDIHAKNQDGKTAVDLAGDLYNKLYNRYTTKKLPYFKCSFDTQERIYHTFLLATALPTPANFKQIFEPQTTGWPEFPRKFIQQMMRTYYILNIETIVAKKYKDNKEYYDDYIENKQEIRRQLLAKPEPQLLWSA